MRIGLEFFPAMGGGAGTGMGILYGCRCGGCLAMVLGYFLATLSFQLVDMVIGFSIS